MYLQRYLDSQLKNKSKNKKRKVKGPHNQRTELLQAISVYKVNADTDV